MLGSARAERRCIHNALIPDTEATYHNWTSRGFEPHPYRHYATNLPRLLEIKHMHDPEHVFVVAGGLPLSISEPDARDWGRPEPRHQGGTTSVARSGPSCQRVERDETNGRSQDWKTHRSNDLVRRRQERPLGSNREPRNRCSRSWAGTGERYGYPGRWAGSSFRGSDRASASVPGH
jgi:hypothetical protein